MQKFLMRFFLVTNFLLILLLGIFFTAFNTTKTYAGYNTSGQIVSLPYDKCIDLINNDRTDGNTIQLMDCKVNEPAQRWEYNSSSHRITIVGDPSKCLDLHNNYQNDGEKIKIMPCTNNNLAQEWYVTSDGQIQLYSNRTVCIDAYANYNGARVYLHHCHGGANQKWNVSLSYAASCNNVIWAGAGKYCNGNELLQCNSSKQITSKESCSFGCQVNPPGTPDSCKQAFNTNLEGAIVDSASGKCLDLRNNDRTDHNIIHSWNCTQNNPAQGWFYNSSTQQIQLRNDMSKCLDVNDGQYYNGNRIKILNCAANNPAQKWAILSTGEIKPRGNIDYCVDAAGTNSGDPIYLYRCHGGANQKWSFKDQNSFPGENTNKCTNIPTGSFCGEYYSNPNLDGTPVYNKPSSSINENWGTGAPANLPSDNFSVRWQGKSLFKKSIYTFIASTDDGMRVYVDGRLEIDSWKDQSATEYTDDIVFTEGYHDIKVEYYERTGDANAKVQWFERQVLTDKFTVKANDPYSDMNRYADTGLLGNPTRKIFFQYADESKRSNLYDGKSKVWIISHGWGEMNPALKTVATEIFRKEPDSYIIILDWTDASTNGSFLNQGNTRAIQWAAPTAREAFKKLNEWGLTKAFRANINLTGHSFGAYMSSEIASLYKDGARDIDTVGSSKVNSIIALDPANLYLPTMSPNYDMDGNTPETQTPVRFFTAARFTRAFVAVCNPSGSIGISQTAHEFIYLDYKYAPESDCSNLDGWQRKHGQPVRVFADLIKYNSPFGIANLNESNPNGSGNVDGTIEISKESCNENYDLRKDILSSLVRMFSIRKFC